MEVQGFINFLLYAGYTFIATMLFWLMTGALGFLGCFYFVRSIYGSVKVD
jgi:transmembrane 9 superfamily protein 2/4